MSKNDCGSVTEKKVTRLRLACDQLREIPNTSTAFQMPNKNESNIPKWGWMGFARPCQVFLQAQTDAQLTGQSSAALTLVKKNNNKKNKWLVYVYMSASRYCIFFFSLIFSGSKKKNKTNKKVVSFRNCSNIHKYQYTTVNIKRIWGWRCQLSTGH